MASSLSNFVNNLSERIRRIKGKFGHNDKKCETCRIECKYCDSFLEYTKFKYNLIEYKFLCCSKNYQRKFDEKSKERFFNTHTFLTMITKSLFYYCEKVFIFMNIWIIRKNSMKHHYLKNKIFTVT